MQAKLAKALKELGDVKAQTRSAAFRADDQIALLQNAVKESQRDVKRMQAELASFNLNKEVIENEKIKNKKLIEKLEKWEIDLKKREEDLETKVRTWSVGKIRKGIWKRVKRRRNPKKNRVKGRGLS